MNNILVSIIIPCYNVESYIAECIESAIVQTHRPIEIIAVDNNSTDKTNEILLKLQEEYNGILTVLSEQIQGPSAARNAGMFIAKGDWLQFLDADDVLLPEKIEHQLTLVKENDGIDLIVGAHRQRLLNGSYKNFYPNEEDDPFKKIVIPALGYTVSNLFRSKHKSSQPLWDIDLIGPDDANFIFDYLILSAKNIIYDYKLLTVKRERLHGQITKSNTFDFHYSSIRYQKRVMNYLKEFKSDFYLKNEEYYIDNLYYFVYRLGLFNSESGLELFKKLLPANYFPITKSNNRITTIHSFGFRFFGFKYYVKIRRFFQEKLKI